MSRNRVVSWIMSVGFAALCSGSVAWPAAAGTLAGRVVDRDSGVPVAGVEVRSALAARVVLSDAQGRFALDFAADTAQFEVSCVRVGYEPEKLQVVVAQLPAGEALEIRMRALNLRGETVVVEAARARRRESPVPHASLSQQDLADRYTTQDLPDLLASLPSTIYYSENGNGVGYNYLTLRGFDQRRISVLVNGVPQNDPEDQNVYWLDFPDLAANLQDVQVQRGAGSGFYGPPAIGGAVNLVTAAFQPQAGVRVQSGAGSFGTRKASVRFNSGLVNGTYAFQGRYSRLLSDGYRHDAWVDFTSYYLSAARYDPRMSTRIHVYGGPVADGLAYYGVPLAATRDRDARRGNPLAGGGQIENFSQPHYEVLHDWRLNGHTRLANTAFYVQGDGFFDFDGSFADTTYYRLTSPYGFHPVRNPGRSLIRAFVRNRHGGWLPRVEWKHARGELSVGGEVRVHRSEHWGKIRFAESLPDSAPDGAGGRRYQPYDPERKYYSYRGGKDVLGAFVHEVWHVTPRLQATGDLQLTHNRYRIYDEAFVGNDFAQDYFFANPRAGANFNFNSTWHSYASYGYVQREPRLKNLYDAAESSGGATPQYANAAGGGFDFAAPFVHPEKLHDFEAGAGARWGERATLDVNAYWMDFRDEIVGSGQLDRFGQPVTGNARRSVHGGVEVAAALRPYSWLELGANSAWSRNLFRDHRVFEDADGAASSGGVQLGGNEIAGFPRFVSNLRGTVRGNGATVALAARYVGGFFTTNFENPNQYVTPHCVLDADAAYALELWRGQPARVHLQVRNLLDRLYVLQGQGDEYFPAATRNAFLSLEFGL